MPKLPVGEHKFYIGIDPGFSGAIALMNAAGTSLRVWDMPVSAKAKDRQREINLDELTTILRRIARFPAAVAGLEWPTTRPGEGAERSERFGRQKGILQTALYYIGVETVKLSPALWTGRLGLPGKDHPGALDVRADLFGRSYPVYAPLIRGPRGGIRDGRLDAFLIAHFLRVRTAAGIRTIVDRYGPDSPQAWTIALGGRRRKPVMRMP